MQCMYWQYFCNVNLGSCTLRKIICHSESICDRKILESMNIDSLFCHNMMQSFPLSTFGWQKSLCLILSVVNSDLEVSCYLWLASCPWGSATAHGVGLLTKMYAIYMMTYLVAAFMLKRIQPNPERPLLYGCQHQTLSYISLKVEHGYTNMQ